MDAIDFVVAIVKALIRSNDESISGSEGDIRIDESSYLMAAGAHYVSHILYVDCPSVVSFMLSGDIRERLKNAGILTFPVRAKINSEDAQVETNSSFKAHLSFVFDEIDLARTISNLFNPQSL